DWSALLGRAPSWRGRHPEWGTANVLFRLGDAYLELLAAPPEATGWLAEQLRETLGERAERPFGLALGTADVDAAVASVRAQGVAVFDPAPGEGVDEGVGTRRTWASAFVAPEAVRGLRVLLIEHRPPAERLPAAPPLAPAATGGA